MMKKRIIALLLALLMILPATEAFAATSSAKIVLPETFTALNVREGPGTDYDVVTWVKDGEKIKVLDWGTVWTEIRVLRNNEEGFVKNQYISTAPKPSKDYDMGRVRSKYASSSINVREKASTRSAVVTTVKRDMRLRLYSKKNGWYYVRTPAGYYGYISAEYVIVGAPYTTTTAVHLRKKPNGSIIRTLYRGATVTVLSVNGDWSYVKYGAKKGYVYSMYLR